MDVKRAGELLAAERRRIEQALADLREAVTMREVADGGLPSGQASDLTEAEYEEGSRAALMQELAALERAEARLAAGTYGRSVESGEPIADARLAAKPLAELTIDEERRAERGG